MRIFMKKSSFVLFLLTAGASFGQSQPDPNLTFDLDDFVKEPNLTLSVGSRSLSGVKTTFGGSSHVETKLADIPLKGTDAVRTYSDGTVGVDARIVLNDDGTEVTVTNADGTISTVPITPDGKTNTWSFVNAAQVLSDGTLAMHSYSYSADVLESGLKAKDAGLTSGVEVALRRDMNKISTRFDWAILGGLSVNDIRAQKDTSQRATITTLTDVYAMDATSADGTASPPAAPYSAPSTGSKDVVNADGTTTPTSVDTTVLLGNEPLNRTITSTVNTGSLTNHWRLKGAYYTFRAGPTIVIPFNEHWRATLSFGGALVYAGTTYSVEQEFTPDDGGQKTTAEVDSVRSRLLPGYFADANVEYWLTDRAGLYLGAVHQSTGHYNQTIDTDTGSYTTHIDLSNLQGFRMGMNVRF